MLQQAQKFQLPLGLEASIAASSSNWWLLTQYKLVNDRFFTASQRHTITPMGLLPSPQHIPFGRNPWCVSPPNSLKMGGRGGQDGHPPSLFRAEKKIFVWT